MNSLLFSFATALPAFNSTGVPAALYDAQDLVGLNTFEELWARWFMWIGDEALATNLLVFLSHEVSAAVPTLLN